MYETLENNIYISVALYKEISVTLYTETMLKNNPEEGDSAYKLKLYR